MNVESSLRLIAGLVTLASTLAGMFFDPRFFWVSLFVGANLVQSAFSGWCPAMTILRKAGVPER